MVVVLDSADQAPGTDEMEGNENWASLKAAETQSAFGR